MKAIQKGALSLLALVSVLGIHCGPAPAPPRAKVVAAPFAFMDATEEAGIDFSHTNGATGRKYMPETIGSGGGFFDADGDGWLDILLLNGRQLDAPTTGQPVAALYLNQKNGKFTDATKGSGLDVPLCAMGCSFGDFDKDGLDDVFITTALEPNRLFRNQGGGRFRDVTERAGVDDRRWGTSCAWLDFDRDGWLDLFVCNYVRYRSLADDKWCSNLPGKKSYCSPEVYEGEACLLYRNRGDGTFEDVSVAAGIASHPGKALGVAVLDLEDDGFPDLAVANDKRPNFLFRNRPAPDGSKLRRVYADEGMLSGFALDATGITKAGMGVDAAEASSAGHLALIVSNFSNEGLSYFIQRAAGQFEDRSAESGLASGSWLYLGFGVFFADLDNDGDLDAFVANGHVQDDIEMVQPNIAFAQRNLLFENTGAGQFREVGARCGEAFARKRVSRGAAFADYDRDGDLDILVTNNGGPAELLRNDTKNGNHWLRVELEDKRKKTAGRFARNPHGARIEITVGSAKQARLLRSGSSYLSDSRGPAHFGLGRSDRYDEIRVRTPDGQTLRFGQGAANSELAIPISN